MKKIIKYSKLKIKKDKSQNVLKIEDETIKSMILLLLSKKNEPKANDKTIKVNLQRKDKETIIPKRYNFWKVKNKVRPILLNWRDLNL